MSAPPGSSTDLQELDRELAAIPGSVAAVSARDRIRAALTT
ncbi:hypothetical protein [Streptomyces sp. NRRL F-4489]|nr:hypothetical protein [Streptomyces sp. NRRL F-4489]